MGVIESVKQTMHVHEGCSPPRSATQTKAVMMGCSPQTTIMMISKRNQCCFVGALIPFVMREIKRDPSAPLWSQPALSFTFVSPLIRACFTHCIYLSTWESVTRALGFSNRVSGSLSIVRGSAPIGSIYCSRTPNIHLEIVQ